MAEQKLTKIQDDRAKAFKITARQPSQKNAILFLGEGSSKTP
jgi:hypothetical protein